MKYAFREGQDDLVETLAEYVDPQGMRGMKFTKMKPMPLRLERRLTKHTVTRWYRPPEIILMQRYSYAIDVWSLGCIFGEMLGKMSWENIYGPMFPGKSCYPISPTFKNIFDESTQNYTRERIPICDIDDQLNLILRVLGQPSDKDLKFVKRTCTSAWAYVRTFSKYEGISLRKEFYRKGASDAALSLLVKMLRFNPDVRISVEDAAQDRFVTGKQPETDFGQGDMDIEEEV
jgi:mitogen-activated protein kinase 1/3